MITGAGLRAGVGAGVCFRAGFGAGVIAGAGVGAGIGAGVCFRAGFIFGAGVVVGVCGRCGAGIEEGNCREALGWPYPVATMTRKGGGGGKRGRWGRGIPGARRPSGCLRSYFCNSSSCRPQK